MCIYCKFIVHIHLMVGGYSTEIISTDNYERNTEKLFQQKLWYERENKHSVLRYSGTFTKVNIYPHYHHGTSIPCAFKTTSP